MDRSYTSTALQQHHQHQQQQQRPSLPLSASHYSTPGRPSASASATTRNVHFTESSSSSSPQSQSQRVPFSAPPGRIQSSYTSTISTTTPTSTRLPVQRTTPSSTSAVPGSVSGLGVGGGPLGLAGFSSSSSPTAVKRVLNHATAKVEGEVKHLVSATAGKVEKRFPTTNARPMGRQEAAKRLRVNSVLLVGWWAAGRTDGYKYLSGHLVLALPSLDTPLHLLETLLTLILMLNIAHSMLALNRLSSSTLPSSPPPPSPSTSPTTPQQQQHLHHSSPKTRPSPSGSPSTTTPTFRRSAMTSPNPPSPQTPSSLGRSSTATAALRRSVLVGGGGGGSPLGMGMGRAGAGEAGGGASTGLVEAFRARHYSPVSSVTAAASRVSLNSQEAIERLFDA